MAKVVLAHVVMRRMWVCPCCDQHLQFGSGAQYGKLSNSTVLAVVLVFTTLQQNSFKCQEGLKQPVLQQLQQDAGAPAAAPSTARLCTANLVMLSSMLCSNKPPAHRGPLRVCPTHLTPLQDCRPGIEACAASASADPRSQAPVARSTLQLDKLPAQQLSVLDMQWQDDVLRYGQRIRLLAHPAAQVSNRELSACVSRLQGKRMALTHVPHEQPAPLIFATCCCGSAWPSV
jgi:hypothetical protein